MTRHGTSPPEERQGSRALLFAVISGTLILLFGALLAILDMPNPGPDDTPPPHLEASLVREAAFADGRLWLLAGDGGLSSIKEDGRDRVAELINGKAMAICVRSGRLLVLVAAPADRWALRGRTAAGWSEVEKIDTRGDDFIGMACDAKGISLLTSRRLIEVADSPPRWIVLSDRIHPREAQALLRTGDRLLAGSNLGEFGGGLQRIDRSTGTISEARRNDTGEACDAMLDRRCTPVTGLAPSPWSGDCAVAAVGMEHLLTIGRLVEICGDRIELLFEKDSRSLHDRPGKRPFNQVAFFGVTASGDTLWAVAADGLYRFRDRKLVERSRLPHFKTVDGVKVSFALPGVVLVATNGQQSASLSGNVSILVPR